MIKCVKWVWYGRSLSGMVLMLGALAHVANGQNVSVVRANSFEVGGFVGASYGIDDFRVMGGGNVTYAVNKYILPYAEYSYFPGIGRQSKGTFPGTGAPYTLNYSIPLSDFHGGVHIRLPIFREKPVVPYAVFGLGGLTNSSRNVTASYTDASGAVTQQQIPVTGNTEFAVNGGGGLRFYIGQRYGFRLEAKAYKPTGAFGNTFGKVEAGFFFQLR